MQLKSSPEQVRQRSVIEILQESLQDKPNRSVHGNQETYNEVRYKLLIDPSEDDSLSRLLLMYHILDPEKTKTFMCSDFPEDNQLQKVDQHCVFHLDVTLVTVLCRCTYGMLNLSCISNSVMHVIETHCYAMV